MKVAVVGFGVEGRSSLDYFLARGDEVTVCDANNAAELPATVPSRLGKDYLNDLDEFDVIVRTAGMHPRIILEPNPNVQAKLTTQVNEFIRLCPSKNIIGVTGTKGKGTTSTLIAKMLEAAGKTVHLGGNIGTPVLGLLQNIHPDDWVVLELSSFQLIDLRHSPHIAVCLMVVPEHLDWHEDMEEYIAAKQQLFINQTPDDIAIYYAKSENSESIAAASEGQQIPYMEEPGAVIKNSAVMIDGTEVCKTTEIKLLGEHNWQNVCAATTAVWQVTNDVEALRSVLTSFSGLEYRLEFVRELHEVKYYNDSFGTTPETAIVAIEAFKEPKVVILGGSDKGAPFDELAKAVKMNNVRSVIAIGLMGPKITAELKKIGYTNVVAGAKTMSEIVAQAKSVAQPGDIVLLSTGCASFDMFKNYKDRAAQFDTAVKALQ